MKSKKLSKVLIALSLALTIVCGGVIEGVVIPNSAAANSVAYIGGGVHGDIARAGHVIF